MLLDVLLPFNYQMDIRRLVTVKHVRYTMIITIIGLQLFLGCNTATHQRTWLTLPVVKEGLDAIVVSGTIDKYSFPRNFTFITGTIRLKEAAVDVVKFAYCEGHSALPIHSRCDVENYQTLKDGYIQADGTFTWNIKLPANTALLGTILSDIGMRCYVFTENHGLQHFYLRSEIEGAFESPTNKSIVAKDADYNLTAIQNMISRAPSLVWIVIFIVCLAVLLMTTIPIAVCVAKCRYGLKCRVYRRLKECGKY